MIRVLICDDEPLALDRMRRMLEKVPATVCVGEAENGQQLLQLVPEVQPDLILLDIMLPKMDGVETCRRLRTLPGGNFPYIVFLTARSEEYSEIAGLEAGADDYITKPIKPRLLITRINAMLRRDRNSERASDAPKVLQIGDLEINREEYVVRKAGKALAMPKKEFELLIFLASHPGKVYSREVLLEKVWGTNVHVVDRTIDVHIRKLRGKIGKQWIKTVQGVGYKFSEPK